MIRTGKTESYGGRGFQQVYSIYLPLSYIGFFSPFFVKFSIIMGTSVQKDFFLIFFLAMSGPFIEELLNKCFHLQENAKKIFK